MHGIHAGRNFLVVGCGVSAVHAKLVENCVVVGVNDVARLIQPDYLVVVNSQASFGDRWRWIAESTCPVFTHMRDLPLGERRVMVQLGKSGGVKIDGFRLPFTNNSPYVAACIAEYLGAKKIGLLGVDFTDNHFFASTGEHRLTKQLRVIDGQYGKLSAAMSARGVELLNLSADSRLKHLKRVGIEEFNKYI